MIRVGPWIQTRYGRAFHPLDPRAEDICIEDIAHALGNICRYSGHCRRFYSVAEHSILVSKEVPPEHALQALLHDATEAYLLDIPRPIKPLLGGYVAMEKAAWLAIAEHFGVDPVMHDEIHRADIAVLLAERDQLLDAPPKSWFETDIKPAQVGEIECFAPREAKYQFLQRFILLNSKGKK